MIEGLCKLTQIFQEIYIFQTYLKGAHEELEHFMCMLDQRPKHALMDFFWIVLCHIRSAGLVLFANKRYRYSHGYPETRFCLEKDGFGLLRMDTPTILGAKENLGETGTGSRESGIPTLQPEKSIKTVSSGKYLCNTIILL